MSSDSELIKQCINLINNKESNALVNFLQNLSNSEYNIIFNPINNIYLIFLSTFTIIIVIL